MLVVIAFCHKDANATANLLDWMYELDGRHSTHQLLLVRAMDTPSGRAEKVIEAGKRAFALVESVRTNRSENRAWPRGPNMMFRCATAYVKRVHAVPFWWHEPDCIPLCPNWLHALEAEYKAAGKPFMGAVVTRPCKHLTGCAIYPHNIGDFNAAMLQADLQAFDCVKPELTLPHTHHTKLFHHQWSDKTANDVPTFPSVDKLKIIGHEAVVFHRNKDQSLIDRLRQVGADKNSDWRTIPPTFDQATAQVREMVAECHSNPTIITTVEEVEPPTPKEPKLPTTVHPVPKGTPSIYTYFNEVPTHRPPIELIEFWQECWRAQGWNPIVLGEDVAKKHFRYKSFVEAVSKLPTVNAKEYELACYVRHLAMTQVRGGLLLDYDVFPRQFTPKDCLTNPRLNRTIVIMEPTRVPCALKANQNGFERICDLFESYEVNADDVHDGKPHCSDMEILRKTRRFGTEPLCVEYLCSGSEKRDDPGDGWKTSAMIHFSTASLRKSGRPINSHNKMELIKEVLDSLTT